MPQAAPKPCTHVGCGALVRDGSSRCGAHPRRENKFADKRRGSRHERGYGTAWDKLRREVMDRDFGLCQPCLREDRVRAGRAVDHIVSKGEGGTDDLVNLQCICGPCHQAKTQDEAARARGRSSGR